MTNKKYSLIRYTSAVTLEALGHFDTLGEAQDRMIKDATTYLIPELKEEILNDQFTDKSGWILSEDSIDGDNYEYLIDEVTFNNEKDALTLDKWLETKTNPLFSIKPQLKTSKLEEALVTIKIQERVNNGLLTKEQADIYMEVLPISKKYKKVFYKVNDEKTTSTTSGGKQEESETSNDQAWARVGMTFHDTPAVRALLDGRSSLGFAPFDTKENSQKLAQLLLSGEVELDGNSYFVAQSDSLTSFEKTLELFGHEMER